MSELEPCPCSCCTTLSEAVSVLDSYIPVRRKCPRCKGTGVDPVDETKFTKRPVYCITCNQSGYVWEGGPDNGELAQRFFDAHPELRQPIGPPDRRE